MDNLIGQQFSRWEARTGGMAAVYQTQDTRLKHNVAFKNIGYQKQAPSLTTLMRLDIS